MAGLAHRAAAVTPIRAATYNVHKCRGMDGRRSTQRIAGVLEEVGADIIALQEVMEHQAQAIVQDLRMEFVMGENRRHRGYAYGNAILSRWPIRASRNYDLSIVGRE